MLHRMFFSLIGLTLLLLTACESYDLRVNDTVVYTPQPLFSDFDTADAALRICLEQAISDATVKSANELTSLNCSHAGIGDLDGLSGFAGIKILRLSSNNVRNLVEIGAITALEELHLDNNQVIDPVPLYQLPALNFVDLSDNPRLQCPRSGSFALVKTVILPSHCR